MQFYTDLVREAQTLYSRSEPGFMRRLMMYIM